VRRQIFRVPLHSDDEGQIGPLQSFDDAIRRAGRDQQPAAGLAHRLVMARVDLQLHAEDAAELRAGHDPNRM
jgi:hypothetical protein